MKKTFLMLAMAATLTACSTTGKVEGAPQITQTDVKYDTYFTDRTMRYDFHHAGDSDNEYYYFDKLIREELTALAQSRRRYDRRRIYCQDLHISPFEPCLTPRAVKE